MNYQLTLPDGFDLAGLRERIPSIGARFDGLPGLAAKAFLLREKGANDSPVNQYAPFYVWADDTAAETFLWGGGGFAGVVEKYGRPIVQTWIGAKLFEGAASSEVPRWAVRTVELVAADVDPAPAILSNMASAKQLASEGGVHSVAAGVDPRSWQLVTLAAYVEKPAQYTGELYELVHLSVGS